MSAAVLRLGFHPLNDCAALAVAQAGGMFEAEGLDVALSREPSWSNIRDKLVYGLLEGAYVLAPMPIASAMGAPPAGGIKLIAPMALGINGNSMIAVGGLADELATAQGPEAAGAALARVVQARDRAGAAPLVFGVPFPVSAHAYVLRTWLTESGIDPDRHVTIMVTPPVRMTAMARQGLVDIFCVGAPWGQSAALNGLGRLLFSDQDYWPGKPEKVLALSAEWAAAAPDIALALMRAVLRAARWADDPANRAELVSILADPAYVGAPAAEIEAAFEGGCAAGHVFAADHATYPWPAHAAWFARQIQKWGHASKKPGAEKAGESVYRPDLWRAAAAEIGLPAPEADAQAPGFSAFLDRHREA